MNIFEKRDEINAELKPHGIYVDWEKPRIPCWDLYVKKPTDRCGYSPFFYMRVAEHPEHYSGPTHMQFDFNTEAQEIIAWVEKHKSERIEP